MGEHFRVFLPIVFVEIYVIWVMDLHILIISSVVEQDKHYLDNLDASVIILRKLSDTWKTISDKHTALESHREALKVFHHKV